MTTDLMRKTLLYLAFLASPTLFSQTTFTSAQSGPWNDGASWGNTSPGSAGTDYPGTGDHAVIDGHAITYTINAPADFGDITLQNSGSFITDGTTGTISFDSFTQDASSSFSTAANAGAITFDADVTVNGTLTVQSILTINGDFTLAVGGTTTIQNLGVLRVISSSTAVEVNADLTISQGVFALNANGSNSITVNAASDFIVADGGSFYFEGNGAANITNNGNITAEQGGQIINNSGANINIDNQGSITFEWGSSYYEGDGVNKISVSTNRPTFEIALSSGGQWRQLGSPFADGTTLSVLSGTDLNPNVTAGQRNMYYWDATVASAGDNAPGWTEVTSLGDAFDGDDASGRAYNIYTGDANYPFSNSGVVSFDEQLQSPAQFDFTTYNSKDPNGDGSSTDQGWNLVYNPYSHWLDIEDVFDDTDNDNFTYEGAHFWDVSAGQYVAYMANGESLITHSNGQPSGATGSRRISPFQAFWVKLESGNGTTETLRIKHSHSAFIAPADYYMKNSTVESRIRLNTFAVTDSAWDQVLVSIDPYASVDRVGREDAYDRVPSFGVPNMTLLHADGSRLSIDTRPLDSTTTIPMSFTNAVDGQEYYIELDKSYFDQTMGAFLEDVKTGTIHDLQIGAYRFAYDANWGGVRFMIYLSRSTIGIEESVESLSEVWIHDNVMQIRSEQALRDVILEELDLSGRLISRMNLELSTGVNEIELERASAGSVRLYRIIEPTGSVINLKHIWR
ncbi:hypothetical protein [Phaeocystidibacter luteus]|uniref:Carbohydrate-binding domain-containing protein n=1 Tax=Phaeocystidibacter luteus TaxID=911197 RepID=A0A6N6RGN0_9FLAO|nr:hypothetical protein [Phaeocystidibacter luteus]KAB2807723.1 carbohydrate-binding domain-containing protein [Phaeocystidibacter luteus]